MIIVMGVPGAGKTSVLKGVTEKKPEYKIVNYGDLMLEIFREKYGVQNRDDMRKASVAQQKAVQEAVAQKLSEMDANPETDAMRKKHGIRESKKTEKIILDTHCSILTPKGYLPGLPFELLKKLKVERLVLVSATMDEIYNRRKNDPTRTREVSKDEIIEHDQMNKAYLAAYSAFTGAPATIVMNRDNKVSEAVEKFASLLE